MSITITILKTVFGHKNWGLELVTLSLRKGARKIWKKEKLNVFLTPPMSLFVF